MIVKESIYEELLYESILNEKFDIQNIKEMVSKISDKKGAFKRYLQKFNSEKNISVKKLLAIALILLMAGNFVIKNNKWAISLEYNKKIQKEIPELVNKEKISADDIRDIVDKIVVPENPHTPFSVNIDIIKDVNQIVNGRLSSKKIPQYNKFDEEIASAVENLKSKGEDPNPDLIKAIMLIETGMNPRKNYLGFEGFPQTKEHIINGWTDKDGEFHPGINQKYNTNFTLKDMYNATKSAEFIHYYIKALKKSSHVDSLEDLVIAYNWGMGNLGKYKRGEKDLPTESKDYANMMKILQKYFS